MGPLFESPRTRPRHLGCFGDAEAAKDIAQRLHSSGWPETDVGQSRPEPAAAPDLRRTVVGRYTIESDPMEAGITWDDDHVDVYLHPFREPGAEERQALRAEGIAEEDLPAILAVLRTHARELNAFRPPD
ncbi:MAG: hypothetical protein IPK80_01285 [Nannocystis sp.]|nr:hypothetical protein [Nannocystis sp.]